MKKRISFKQYLRKFRKDDTGIGDIARDILQDPNFPKKPHSEAEVEEYLRQQNASESAIIKAGQAFYKYTFDAEYKL